MSKTVGRYHADEKLAELLKAAAEAHEPLEIVTEERTYELEVRDPDSSQDIWKDYDAEAALAAVRNAPRLEEPVDIDALNAFIAEIRAERDQDSIGSPRDW